MPSNVQQHTRADKKEKHTVVLQFCTVDSLTIFVPYTLLPTISSV